MARGGGNKRSFRGGGAGSSSSGDANKRAKYLPKGSVSWEKEKEKRRKGIDDRRPLKKKLNLDPPPPKKQQGNSIPLGSRGFLVSCVAGKEAEAGREIVDALEEEYERMARKKESSSKAAKAAKAAVAPAGAAAAAAAPRDGGEEKEEKGEKEEASGAYLASALAAELSSLKDEKGDGTGNVAPAGKKKKGLRFHALGLPGLVFVSGAGSAAIAAANAAAEEAEFGAGTSGAAATEPHSSSSSSSAFNPSPSEVAHSLCGRVRDERAGTTRFCLRLLPADDVVFVGGGSFKSLDPNNKATDGGEEKNDAASASRAAVEAAARAITQGLRPLLTPHFAAAAPSSGEGKACGDGGEEVKTPLFCPARTFAVAYEKRASTSALERQIVIDAAMAALPSRKEGSEEEEIKVDLDAPDVTALIQVVKGAATLGVVRDYRGLLKLNLRELAAPGSTAAADNSRRRVNGGGGGGSAAGKMEGKEEETKKEEKVEEKKDPE